MLISPQPDQEGNKLQRQKILMFIYLIFHHNWRNISTIYIYIYTYIYIYIYNKTSTKRNILITKQNTSGSRSGQGLISTPVLGLCRGMELFIELCVFDIHKRMVHTNMTNMQQVLNICERITNNKKHSCGFILSGVIKIKAESIQSHLRQAFVKFLDTHQRPG